MRKEILLDELARARPSNKWKSTFNRDIYHINGDSRYGNALSLKEKSSLQSLFSLTVKPAILSVYC